MKETETEANPNLTTKEGIMNLTGIFEFVCPESIRIKGTRVGIEIVIEKFLDGANPEEIRRHHLHLTLKHIYGTIA